MNSHFFAILSFLAAIFTAPLTIAYKASQAFGAEVSQTAADAELNEKWQLIALDLRTSCLATSDHTENLEAICGCSTTEEVRILQTRYGSPERVPEVVGLSDDDATAIATTCIPETTRVSRRLTFN